MFEDPSISVSFVNWLREAVVAKQQDALSKKKAEKFRMICMICTWALLALLRCYSHNCNLSAKVKAGC